MLTINDILQEVPVSARTIRNWTNAGLLKPPVKVGLGKGRGTAAYYTEETLDRARFIHNLRNSSRTETLKEKLVQIIGSSKLYVSIDEEGRLTLNYKPKSFQEGE